MQHLLDQMAADGWAGLDTNPDQLQADMARLRAEAIKEALPVAECFDTPAGQHVLKWLIAKTLLRQPSDEELAAKTAEEFALLKARRDGQNGIVFMILSALQVAHGEGQEGSR